MRKKFFVGDITDNVFMDNGEDDDAIIFINGVPVFNDHNHLAGSYTNRDVTKAIIPNDTNIVAVKFTDWYCCYYGFNFLLYTKESSRLESLGSDRVSMRFSPNPAQNVTVIQFALPQLSNAHVGMYDVNGKEIAMLLNAQMQAGEHSLQLNTSAFPKGVYVVKIIYDGGVESRKLIIQ